MIIKPQDANVKLLLKQLKKQKPEDRAVSTGFPELDHHVRIAKRYLMIVTGYPSSGKSEFVDAMAVNLTLLYNWRVMFYSPENHPVENHMAKLAEKFVGKRIDKFSEPELDKSISYLERHFTWMYPDETDMDTLLSLAQKEQQSYGLDMLVLDPWSSITRKRGGELIHEYVQEALSKLIRFARDNDILVAIVAHPKTPTFDQTKDNAAPTLYDISDGAMWRNKADYGIIVHRPDLSRNEVEIRVGKIKQKWMGKVGKVIFDYDFESGRLKSKSETGFYLPTEIHVPF